MLDRRLADVASNRPVAPRKVGARHAFSGNWTVPMSIQSLPVAYVERSRRAAGQLPGGFAGGFRGASGTGVVVAGISMLGMPAA